MIESRYFTDLNQLNKWLHDNSEINNRESIINIIKDNRKSEVDRRYQLLYWKESKRAGIGLGYGTKYG